MKRKLAFFLAIVMMLCLCLTACGGDESKKDSDKDGDKGGNSQPATTTEALIEVPALDHFLLSEIEANAEVKDNFTIIYLYEDAGDRFMSEGEIFKQEPAAGTKVKKGAPVTLYVNSVTPKDCSLPADAVIEGAHKNDVRKLLQDNGFTVKEIISGGTNVPADCVISINIAPGKSYPYGTAVTMVVSTGPSELPPIEFPSVIIGESKEVAVSALEAYGFVGNVSFESADYTDEQFAREGVVMGVKIDGELLAELPDEINPMADLTLVISSGKKAE